jgi:hypothetical protein
MRAQDFIQEAISFSNLKQPIQAFLENSVSSCMANEIPGTIKYAIERKYFTEGIAILCCFPISDTCIKTNWHY